MSHPQREIRISFNVVRVDAVKQEVTGEVYVPFDPQPGEVYPLETINSLVDSWGTFMRPAELERLGKLFLTDCRRHDRMHDRKTRAGETVESWIVRSDPGCTPGAWAVTVHVSDEVWPDVAAGKLKAFSFDILAARTPTEVRVSGKGKTVDLNGVTDWPFIPKTVEVDGEAALRLDEMTDASPNYVSLVDVGGNRRQFEARAELRFYQETPMTLPAPDPPAAPVAATPSEERGAVAYKDTPQGGPDKWDAPAAKKRLAAWAGVDGDAPTAAAWAKYRQGFAWYDADKADTLGAYSLPHHDVEDGTLVLSRAGVFAAGAAVQGARGGVDIPDDDLGAVKSHLAKHYHAMGTKAPWESDGGCDRE